MKEKGPGSPLESCLGKLGLIAYRKVLAYAAKIECFGTFTINRIKARYIF
jgi:hypothetical protein